MLKSIMIKNLSIYLKFTFIMFAICFISIVSFLVTIAGFISYNSFSSGRSSVDIDHKDNHQTDDTETFLRNQSKSRCGRLPKLEDNLVTNLYWQTLLTSDGSFRLFNAFYDDRKRSRPGRHVRILAMINRRHPVVTTHCQLWYEGKSEPMVVKTKYEYMWFDSQENILKYFQPHLISCKVPAEEGIPSSVSLVEGRCDISTTNLKVIFNKPANETKKDFAVCVKGLDLLNDNLSFRLVEWIEMIKLLGADKIFFYELYVHPKIKKILDYYEAKNEVTVTPLSLAGFNFKSPQAQHIFLMNNQSQKRQNEIIPYNDCFYKNMNSYKFITMLDIDEVIMPLHKQDLSWADLKNRTIDVIMSDKQQKNTHYNVRNIYFFDYPHQLNEFSRYMHMLAHVHRTVNHTKPGFFIKSFFDTERILIAHNHYPLKCLNVPCKSYPLNTTLVQLQHYRTDCVGELARQCDEMKKNIVKDTTIWKFKEKLLMRTRRALKDLQLLPD